MKKSNIGGFTLIELMVVVAIIAILTAIVTANFTTAKAQARDAKRVTDIGTIQSALVIFFDRCNGYPTTIDTTATISSCPTGVTLGTYISKIPTDNGTNYFYAVNNTTPPTDYVLRATLETNSSVLVDAPTTINAPGFLPTPPTCTHTPPSYYYCVQPR